MNKGKTLLYVIIFILLIVIIGFLVYIIVRDRGGKITNQATTTNSSEETAIEGVLFTNSTYNYKLTLPEGWSIDEIYDYARVAFFDPVSQQQEIITELLQGMKIEIYVTAVNESQSLKSLVDEEVELLDTVVSRESTVIDSQTAETVAYQMMGDGIATYIKKDGYLYNIVGYIGDPDEIDKYTKIYNSILTDFEFLD